jgi:hypothetical protein
MTARRPRVDVGRVIEVPARNGGVARLRVFEIKGDQARVDWADRPDDNRFGTWMPIESVDHFESDLNGRASPRVIEVVTTRGYTLTTSRQARDIIDAIVDGRAEMLGKGDDGVVFKVGDFVAKMSTTVPYQPMNPGHRSPAEARDRMVEQAMLANKLARDVPGIARREIAVVADKAFIVRPYYTIPSRLSEGQLAQVATTLGHLHSRGYVLGDLDAFQVGLDDDGTVWFFDLDKLQKGKHNKSNSIWDDFVTEIRALESLYAKSGVPFVPPPGPILEHVWADAVHSRLWFMWLDVDIVHFEMLVEAAIDARIENAARDADQVRKWIGDALAREKAKT